MTTVISVNQSDQESDDGMLRPEPIITRTNSNRSANDTKDPMAKGKKLGHRRVKDGEVTYKKFETTQLMGSIQLGIQQSVGNLGCQEDRDLLHEDFYTVETVVFSRDGTLQKTPAHNYSQFKVLKLLKTKILRRFCQLHLAPKQIGCIYTTPCGLVAYRLSHGSIIKWPPEKSSKILRLNSGSKTLKEDII